MSSHTERVQAHKDAVADAVADANLSPRELEAIWAIWAYVGINKESVLSSYLSNEVGLSNEDIKKVIDALNSLAFSMF